MRNRLGDKVRLQHILEAILEIESYLQESDFDLFLNNSMMRFACVKQLEIIGEAGKHISPELKKEFDSIQWAQITAMRNVFVHEYFGIDIRLVWEIVKNDLPNLKLNVLKLLNTLEG